MTTKFNKLYRGVINEMNEDIMQALGFGESVEDVHNGICPSCKAKINLNDFRDPLSRREYHISGLCQKCQDEVFGTEPEENEDMPTLFDQLNDPMSKYSVLVDPADQYLNIKLKDMTNKDGWDILNSLKADFPAIDFKALKPGIYGEYVHMINCEYPASSIDKQIEDMQDEDFQDF